MVSTYASWELFKDSEWVRGGNPNDGQLEAKPTRFRLTRKGNDVRGAWSQDGGKTWKELDALTLNLKAKVKVGVIVNHNTDSPYSVTFEGFSITPADAKK
jgi:regulation of enolase protein 1 (concanavalin A-like superfamily)